MARSTHFRAFARKEVEFTAQLSHVDSDWQRAAVVVNLGVGGSCVRLSDPLVQGTPIRLRLNAPTLWDPLVLDGQVAWCQLDQDSSSRVGLQFSPENGKAIRHLVELLGLDPY